ncbi:MAG: hypothetical protein JNK77_03320 [Saprospiraceae bacterium]|nr:hypothetical protein [Saprospiraceae bacterium]
MKNIIIVIGAVVITLFFCFWRTPDMLDSKEKHGAATITDTLPTDALSSYWYQGKAEVTRYELIQHRYRGLHKGEAVMVFVTEDFLTDKQVKNEKYTNPNSVLVLKNNAIRKFDTGIYDYSVMASVFTPVGRADYPHTLKLTNTVQEWCGQTYLQVNLKDNLYETGSFSYFENEGDKHLSVPAIPLEDELYNRIRINPGKLPQGEIELLPGAMHVRLMHIDFKPLKAVATLDTYSGKEIKGKDLRVYRLQYPSLNRTLEIIFEAAPPYRIAGWLDTHPSFDKQMRTTIARSTHTTLTDYWNKNNVEDVSLRKKLGLSTY